MPYSKSRSSGAVPYADQILFGKKTLTADTFGQDEMLLPNCPEGVLPGLMRVEIQRSSTKLLDQAADYFKWSITTTSQDDVVGLDDTSCLAAQHIESKGIGLEEVNHVLYYDFPAPLLCSMKKLYLQFKGKVETNVNYRIHWIPRPSSQPQRDNLVSQLQF